ncbi:hypothetical protein FH602_13110 [Leptospira kirschneri]|nr:hypothetical protein [Leptospira kirschneri]UML82218.1 hypothetical protein FH602_13110 [Leptospira kirschneri]
MSASLNQESSLGSCAPIKVSTW